MKTIFAQLLLATLFASTAYPTQITRGLVVPTSNGEIVAKIEDFGKYYALLIGVENYTNLPKLQTPFSDIDEVASILESRYGFEKSIVVKDPTRATLLRKLQNIENTLTAKDNLLIYYAGHGAYDDDLKKGFWQVKDALNDERYTWVSLDEAVRYTLKKTRAKRILVVSDSCYSAALTRSSGVNLNNFSKNKLKYYSKILNKKSRKVLTSGGYENVLDSSSDANHSIFAKVFINTLKNNEKAIFSAEEIYPKIKQLVGENATQTPLYSRINNTGVYDTGGDFIFLDHSILAKKKTTPIKKLSSGKQIKQESKALQLCKAFSYSSRDTVGIMDKRTLRACKKVKSAMGKGFVARTLYKIGNKDEAKELFEQIKPSLLSNINADSAYLLGYLYENVLQDMRKVVEYYTKSCYLDNYIACSNASILYQDKKEYKKAMKFAQKACSSKDGQSCTRIGYLYYEGFGVQKNNKEAVKYFTQGCDLDDGWGCNWLGTMYEKGKGVTADKTKALSLYEKGCSLDYNTACSNASTLYQNKKEYKKAMKFAQKACSSKDGRGCTKVGVLYEGSMGVTKDNKEAVKYFKQGCELDNGWGCSWLGTMYEKGKGTTKNIEKALKAYAKSSDLNNSEGCWREGYIYASDAKKEYKKAAKLFAKSCQLNDKKGCSKLGELYYKKGKLPQDYTQAIKYYKKSCDLGSGYGCIMVGWMYEYGQSVTQNKVKTKKYYKKSCKLGNAQACRYLNMDVKFSLTINTTPPDAKVQIMNIVPKYKNDMSLKKGLYKIKVSKESYETQKFDLELTENTVKAVKLQKVKHSMKNITIIGDKMWQDEVYTIKEKNAQALNIELGKARIWKSALAYCKNLKLGGYDDWRLPNKKDLNSITYKKTKIRNIAPFGYWASSTLDEYGYVSADNIHGIVDDEHWFNKNLVAFVRCIRSKQ